MAKPQGQPPCLQRSIKLVVLYLKRNSLSYSSLLEAKIHSSGTSRCLHHTVHLYKKKGNQLVYDNHQGISLFFITGKTFARVLLNHLATHLDSGTESQSGFYKGHGITDMIFAMSQLQEKCQENCTLVLISRKLLTPSADKACEA